MPHLHYDLEILQPNAPGLPQMSAMIGRTMRLTHITQNPIISRQCSIVGCLAFGFCRRLQPVTILTGLIAALTRLRGAAFHAYPNTMTNTSSDLETVDVS